MAHFARLDQDNKVIEVHALNDSVITDESNVKQEQLGIDFLTDLYGGGWWKQSFKDGSSRKNHASIGFSYDKARDAFIPPQRFASWTLNESTCLWEPPVAYPDDGKEYKWNEATTNWVEIE